MIIKLKTVLRKLLKDTYTLARGAAVNDDEFLNVLLGIYRVSYNTLRDIYYLSCNEDTGASILDLARKIAEHAITVEYMIMKDKNKMAKDFQDYLWVQGDQEIEFLKSIGQNLANVDKELNFKVSEAKKKYNCLSKKLKDRKTWAGRSIDGMLTDMHTNKTLKDFDSSRLSQAYVWCSRLNHPNPMVVANYMNPEDGKNADDYYQRAGLFLATTLHLRLTMRYLDEIRFLSPDNSLYADLANNVEEIYKMLEVVDK